MHTKQTIFLRWLLAVFGALEQFIDIKSGTNYLLKESYVK